MRWSTLRKVKGLGLCALTRINLENVMLSAKQAAEYEKDIIYVKCINMKSSATFL